MTDENMVGKPKYERIEREFYPTIDKDVTRVLCEFLLDQEYLKLSSTIWEPAAGEGHMVEVLREYFHDKNIFTSDIKYCPKIANDLVNFTGEYRLSENAIITNPPFNKLDQFIEKGILYLRGDENCKVLALLARNELDCAKGRLKYFRDCPEFSDKLVLTWRPKWFEDGTSSPRHNYAWYIYRKKEDLEMVLPAKDTSRWIEIPYHPRIHYMERNKNGNME